jgi:hypothetical protein
VELEERVEKRRLLGGCRRGNEQQDGERAHVPSTLDARTIHAGVVAFGVVFTNI